MLKTSRLLFLALLLIATPLVAQDATATQTGPVDKSEQRQNKLVEKIWWNQEKKIGELGLKPEQRAQMDALLTAFLQERVAHSKAGKEALVPFGEALEKGDLAAARARRDQIVDTSTAQLVGQLDMMIEVMQLLTPEQRRTLASTYPMLTSRLWVRTAPLRTNRRNR